SISARTRSILLGLMSARDRAAPDGRVASWNPDLPTCRLASSACRLASARAHHVNRRLRALGHDARLMLAKYVCHYSEEQNHDFRDGQAIAEGLQRPNDECVATKTISSACRRFTACVSDWSASAPVSSTRFAPSCWSAALPCGKGSASCVPSCQACWPCALTLCYREWCRHRRPGRRLVPAR